MEDIEFDLDRLYKIKADHLLSNLSSIIHSLQKLPPFDKYLIRHTPDNHEKALIYKACPSKEGANVLDLHKLYETEHYEPSPVDLIEWTPIDDMEIMPVHHQSNVMPCAFPFEGKKKNKHNNVRNDRDQLVKHAEMKREKIETALAERRKAIQDRKLVVKRQIKNRKNKQKKLEKSIGATLDPYEIFNDNGMVNVSTFVGQTERKKVCEEVLSSIPYDYNDYVREAFGSTAVKADDSESSDDIDSLQQITKSSHVERQQMRSDLFNGSSDDDKEYSSKHQSRTTLRQSKNPSTTNLPCTK